MPRFAESLPEARSILFNVGILLIGFILGAWYTSVPQTGRIGILDGEFESRSVQTTFIFNKTFADAPSAESDRAWASLIPAGRGFIAVDASEQPVVFHAGAAVPPVKSMRTVSVFHQLHCLNQLRRGYYTLASMLQGHEESAQHHHSKSHLVHCFDYLRQALMCNADSTLETLKPESELDGKPRVDGWGTQHTCKNWDDLFAGIARHRVVDVEGID